MLSGQSTHRRVSLSEVLARGGTPIELAPEQTYREVTVRLWGKGVTLRREVLGADIAGARRIQVRAGQFILSRIDARNGAFGIVPDELDGAIVSNDFPVFDVDTKRLDPRYLYWMSKTRWFVELCQGASEGTTNRIRLKEDRFLAAPIALPPVPEQCRIVARIDGVAARIDATSCPRQAASARLADLIASYETCIWPDQSLRGAPPLSAVTSHLARGRQSKQGPSTHFLVKSQHVQMGHYVQTKMTLDPEVADKVTTEAMLQKHDILIACSAAGCLGRVAYYEGRHAVASTDTHVAIARPDAKCIIPEYLFAYLRGAQGQRQLRSRERGDWKRDKVGFRLTELNLTELQKVPVPLPSLQEQERIAGRLNRVYSVASILRRLQEEVAVEVSALLSSTLHGIFSEAP